MQGQGRSLTYATFHMCVSHEIESWVVLKNMLFI